MHGWAQYSTWSLAKRYSVTAPSVIHPCYGDAPRPVRYPVDVALERPERSSRWAALLGVLLPAKVGAALPPALLSLLLAPVQILASWYGFWAAACTGRHPETPRRLVADILRLQGQVASWLYGYTDSYPPCGLGTAVSGVRIEAGPRADGEARMALWPFRGHGGVNRWWAVLGILLPLRALAALPHLVAVAALSVAAAVLGWIGFWIVLFTGRYPRGLWWFNSGVLNWGLRTWGFVLGLTDRYPAFSLA
jgi:hypothetical protein